ncbi:MAG: hypothetical protein MJK14_10685 [Rivularia sp. ALOHA_DT_140]|nr:hypothetical protein [Rivularia sp. ALOHA_DT_140]
MPNPLNEQVEEIILEDEIQESIANNIDNNDSANPAISTDDWSDITKELLDSLPKVWTRGLLYFFSRGDNRSEKQSQQGIYATTNAKQLSQK